MENIAVTQRPIGSCSGEGQLWRPCKKLKGNFSCPANLTPLLRMNQKKNTSVEQKESKGGRESEPKSETSCLEVPHLYNDVHCSSA
ncbi:Ubiquitin-associated and SH3 domain containing protein A [Dissostichus eleginoides]|uniref:Ubiquitin-associated and SH3 domain containing protein A n=1 Tax=Dissostichus eleginoides TaxID=100907 RepID=A0AAD9CNJ2_DISEL|nr:Ubiquitin-associated and SH3 domain containing protein A [Dissostichus eleginoides]